MKYANKFIIANWKTNPETLNEARELIRIGNALGDKVAHYAVPAPFLGLLGREFAPVIGSQTVSGLNGGAETGLYTASQAKETGATFTLIGHSEDRKRGATNEYIKQAIIKSLEKNLYICLCIGENVYENFEEELDLQLSILQDEVVLKAIRDNKIMFAYEPVWAIGENAVRSANVDEIENRINLIKNKIKTLFTFSGEIYVLYGGSVNSQNIESILQIDTCDGVLIGRACADREKWQNIVEVLK